MGAFTRFDKWNDDTIRVLVCDESGLFRRRMIVGLEIEPDIEVLAECDDGDQAIRVARDLAPDVAFVSMQIPQVGGVRTTAGIREVIPNCKVVVVLGDEELADAVRAVRAGAVGFLDRDDAVARAALTAREVASEQVVLPPTVAGQVLAELDALTHRPVGGQPRLRPPVLRDNECRVLEQLRTGATIEQVATGLGLRPAAVHGLAASAVGKLHRHARTEAVLYAVADKVYGLG